MLLPDVVDFPLSVRAHNVLADLGIETIVDLARLNTEDLLRRQRNCGEKTVAEIEALARFLGVRLDSAGGAPARPSPRFAGSGSPGRMVVFLSPGFSVWTRSRFPGARCVVAFRADEDDFPYVVEGYEFQILRERGHVE